MIQNQIIKISHMTLKSIRINTEKKPFMKLSFNFSLYAKQYAK